MQEITLYLSLNDISQINIIYQERYMLNFLYYASKIVAKCVYDAFKGTS